MVPEKIYKEFLHDNMNKINCIDFFVIKVRTKLFIMLKMNKMSCVGLNNLIWHKL